MLTQAALLLVLFCFGQTLDVQQADAWIKVAPLAAGFSVLMPARAEEEILPGDDLTAHVFSSRTDNGVYTVAYGDYAPSVHFNVEEELAANRDNFLKRVDASLKTSKPFTINGTKGIEFSGENAQAAFKSRIFIVGTRFYQIAVAVLRGKEDAAHADRFLSSFEFITARAPTKP
jgi:hypothetical protein